MAIGLGMDAMATHLDAPVLPHAVAEKLRSLNETILEAVVAAAARALVDSRGEQPDHPAQIEADSRDVFAAVCCLIVRCARECDTINQYRQQLIDCGVLEDALLNRLAPLLVTHVPPVQEVLRAASGFDFAHVVDVSWRLDYVLRSSSAGNIHEPVYYVQLKLQPPQGDVLQDVSFSCSVEGLRDLVYRLQDATNTIEKIATPAVHRRATVSAE